MSTSRFIELLNRNLELNEGVEESLIGYLSGCSYGGGWEANFKSFFYKTFEVSPVEATEIALQYVIQAMAMVRVDAKVIDSPRACCVVS
jgi:hypothetical protein